jgi:hypothetical protein
MISLEQFIAIFHTKKSITYSHFLKHAKVRVGKNQFLLREYIIRKKIDLDNIKLLFENIQKRNEYLGRFYNTSLRVIEPMHITPLPMLSGEMNNNKYVLYKNIIRNLFFWDILKHTKSGIENNPTYLDVLEDLYIHSIIDYKLLTPSAIHYMKEGRIGSSFSSFYFRASILNPYLVYSLNKSVLKGTRVFTPTLGWSSYYYGFAESGITQYVGVDVIPQVCEGAADFAKMHYPDIKTHIVCSPSEKLLNDKSFIKKYRGKFDLVFFSPPYFKLEMYSGGEQSTENYPTYKDWLEQYWEKTIKLCELLLEEGGTLCYILSGYGSKSIKEEYDLIGDMNSITSRYFSLKEIQPMFNKNVHNTSHRETAEKIMIYKK